MKSFKRFREKFERTMVAITFAEKGMHDYALHLLKKESRVKRPQRLTKEKQENRLEL